jgi:AcrR family transcriptional regulator
MSTQISLREMKKARSKIAILTACLHLIGEKSFKDVSVEEICQIAEVSKVTFFKFFPQKEDLLVYFMRLWLDQRIIELAESPKRGFEGIRHLLKSIANGAKDKPGLMLSLISFLAEMKMHPDMPVLSDAEISILFPGKEAIVKPVSPSLGELFYRFIEEAKEDGHIQTERSTDDLVKIMFTIMYGAYLTAHIYSSKEIMAFYELHLDLLISERKEGK